jgi:hypothetical protein
VVRADAGVLCADAIRFASPRLAANSLSISSSVSLSAPAFWSITSAAPLGVTHTTWLPSR